MRGDRWALFIVELPVRFRSLTAITPDFPCQRRRRAIQHATRLSAIVCSLRAIGGRITGCHISGLESL